MFPTIPGVSFTTRQRPALESAAHKLKAGVDFDEGCELSPEETAAVLGYLATEKYRRQHDRPSYRPLNRSAP